MTAPKKKGFSTKVGGLRPREVSLDGGEIVRTRPLQVEGWLPLVVEPARDDVALAEWARDHRATVEEMVAEHGAVLFRGFPIFSTEEFERFASAICPQLFNENGEHPRESVSGNVYTPTFFPPEEKLLWHNENSYNHRWPLKIFFGCRTPAETGGETPIVDSRAVFDALPEETRRPFVELGVTYMRNYGAGLGLDWQTVFQTDDRAEVEAVCRRDDVELEWRDDGRLRTFMRRPAVTRHPTSGRSCWFNQAQHWHPACLPAGESLAEVFEPMDMPRNCFYGDGSPIADETMEEILDVYRRLEVAFPWQAGDVLLLDNMSAAHGRNPFTGTRQIMVAMGDMTSFDELPAVSGDPTSAP